MHCVVYQAFACLAVTLSFKSVYLQGVIEAVIRRKTDNAIVNKKTNNGR